MVDRVAKSYLLPKLRKIYLKVDTIDLRAKKNRSKIRLEQSRFESKKKMDLMDVKIASY